MAPTFPTPPDDKRVLEEGTAFTPRFDANGLVTAVVTDAGDGALLMVAHMNAEALEKTLQTVVKAAALIAQKVVQYLCQLRKAFEIAGQLSGLLQFFQARVGNAPCQQQLTFFE